MVVEAPPASSFEVIKTNLLLQLLVVAFDSPADLRKADELVFGRIRRHRREPDLGGLLLYSRPLDNEPLQIARRMQEFVSVSRPDTQEGKARSHVAAAALPPRDRFPRRRWKTVGQKANRKRSLALHAADQGRWPATTAIGARRGRLRPRGPDRRLFSARGAGTAPQPPAPHPQIPSYPL